MYITFPDNTNYPAQEVSYTLSRNTSRLPLGTTIYSNKRYINGSFEIPTMDGITLNDIESITCIVLSSEKDLFCMMKLTGITIVQQSFGHFEFIADDLVNIDLLSKESVA